MNVPRITWHRVAFVIFFLVTLLCFRLLFASSGGHYLQVISSLDGKRVMMIRSDMDYETVLETLQNMPTTSVLKMKIPGHGPVRHLAMCKDNLVYIYNPKCGSSSMRTILKGKEIEMSGFNTTGYFTFSMLRNPRERIVSAYATMMSRNKGMAGVCKGREFQAPPLPPADASMDTWHTHFISSVSYWIDTLEKKKLESRDCFWNSHLIPQIEFIRGFHLSWLGCLESVNQTYQQMNQHATTVHISPSTRKSNSYEHVKGMPKEKFQTLDVLPNSVIRRIDKVYAQDWELYRAICGSEG